ncbi:MAG: response regulator [Planctomycetaceae bacterium]|nr:response regulator [Planctomycetaceae bacterium]
MPSVLVVDDEATIAWGLARLAREEGHEALTAASAEEALEILAETPCDLVFLDVRLPGVDGLTAMPDFARTAPAPRIIVMTAFGDLQTAVREYGN